MSHLELRSVSKGYGGTEVLTNINLSIDEGEFVALIGFSGSGKTTLMSILAGLIKPDAGEVRLRGQIAGDAGPDRQVYAGPGCDDGAGEVPSQAGVLGLLDQPQAVQHTAGDCEIDGSHRGSSDGDANFAAPPK